jgi:hypothetical protein
VQLVAFAALQLSVEAPPEGTAAGSAVKAIEGAGSTVTVAVCAALPPVPEQVSVKLVDEVRAPVDWLPLVAFVPDQPPDAAQLVAFALLQLSVEEPPTAMLVGLAPNVTVGGGTTVTVALWLAVPPAPVQLSV